MDMFGNYFDKEVHYPSHNIRDLDTIDNAVSRDVFEIMCKESKGDPEFKYDLLVAHLLGIDHAGHTFYSNHTEIQRKVLET